jgi:hypothetical protein
MATTVVLVLVVVFFASQHSRAIGVGGLVYLTGFRLALVGVLNVVVGILLSTAGHFALR